MYLNEELASISRHIITQDNLCTENPAFCVQCLERIGPIDISCIDNDNIYFHDHDDSETYYKDRDSEDWERFKAQHKEGHLPKFITVAGYIEKWITLQMCFTKNGCEQYIKNNGHNLRHYFGTRIYVESFYRNDEMIAIRKSLIGSAKYIHQYITGAFAGPLLAGKPVNTKNGCKYRLRCRLETEELTYCEKEESYKGIVRGYKGVWSAYGEYLMSCENRDLFALVERIS